MRAETRFSGTPVGFSRLEPGPAPWAGWPPLRSRITLKNYPWIEIVAASGWGKPEGDVMPEGATFIGKPFSAQWSVSIFARRCRTVRSLSRLDRRFEAVLPLLDLTLLG